MPVATPPPATATPAEAPPAPADGTVVAPLRRRVLHRALAVGAFAVLTVEVVGGFHRLTRPVVGAAWLAAGVTVAMWAVVRHRRALRRWWMPHAAGRTPHAPRAVVAGTAALYRRVITRSAEFWRTSGRSERLMIITIGALLGVDLVVALLAEPNNFDSQTYHLPKIEHWVAQRDLGFWPTAIHRQVTIPPGAEYLLLHLRLLTGGDAAYNLVQWTAGLGCALVASRIAAQFGGGRRAQLISAFVVVTTPMVVLQATSTQTDLVVALWAGTVATLALDGLARRATPASVLALGVATGLTAVTKTSGLLGTGPMLVLWGVAQLRLTRAGDGRRQLVGVARTATASVGILAVAAVLVGPFMLRVYQEFGHPLGPPVLRESIPMERHDPPSVFVNALRIGVTALDTPVPQVRGAAAEAVFGVAHLIGVDPQDRDTTFGKTTFPVPAWYPDEDRVSLPVAGTLVLVGTVLAIARPRRIVPTPDAPGRGRHPGPGALRGYALACAAAYVLHAGSIKWQPWGNRLLMSVFVLSAPLAGLWLESLVRRRAATAGRSPGHAAGVPAGGRRSIALVAATLALATSALAGVLAVSYGFPRRLVGTGSVFTTGDWETRFLRRPQWADEFEWAARPVKESGARRIGLVQQNDNWEYPWWLLLRGDGRDIVALQSVLPKHAPADPASVDAVVCTGSRGTCARLVPASWRIQWNGYVGYALPPSP